MILDQSTDLLVPFPELTNSRKNNWEFRVASFSVYFYETTPFTGIFTLSSNLHTSTQLNEKRQFINANTPLATFMINCDKWTRGNNIVFDDAQSPWMPLIHPQLNFEVVLTYARPPKPPLHQAPEDCFPVHHDWPSRSPNYTYLSEYMKDRHEFSKRQKMEEENERRQNRPSKQERRYYR